jgi:pimeloyl-ACP methyl ester carboxylesterase
MAGLRWSVFLAVFAWELSVAWAADPLVGHQEKVKVSDATRLDWTFVLASKSLDAPLEQWKMATYDSKRQFYELYVPVGAGAKTPCGIVLFLSAGKSPVGFPNFERACKEFNLIFACPYDAGNDVDPPRRVRIALDVLDDVRRKYPTNPDRTYIGGFSGGARVASAIAFALPELFGGLIGVCAADNLRDESWLTQRAVDRLSVALLTGDGDFNRGELETFRGPLLKELGVRTTVRVYGKMGHSMPNAQQVVEIVRWLDEAEPHRAAFAKKYPASRLAADNPPTKEDWAKALLAEALNRFEARETQFSGVMQLHGIVARWPETTAGREALRRSRQLEAQAERPWEADDLDEQRRFLFAKARHLDAYASGPLPKEYEKTRPSMAREALQLWQVLLEDSPDSPAGKQAARRIPELRKLAEGN